MVFLGFFWGGGHIDSGMGLERSLDRVGEPHFETASPVGLKHLDSIRGRGV